MCVFFFFLLIGCVHSMPKFSAAVTAAYVLLT